MEQVEKVKIPQFMSTHPSVCQFNILITPLTWLQNYNRMEALREQ